jgi:hypothetical protein
MSKAKDPLDHKNITAALAAIIPLLEQRQLGWVITTGFACYLHGVDRPLNDIDIDVDASKDDPKFQSMLEELEPFITSPLENFVDVNYDNWGFEATISGVVLDICSIPEMKVFDPERQKYRLFYEGGLEHIDWIDFEGFHLPVQSKQDVLREKENRGFKREVNLNDIAALKRVMGAS